jgi:polyisoprenoid-binding protein YceI
MIARRFIHAIILATLVVAANIAVPARAAEFGQVIAAKSRMDFAFKQMGVSVDGRFQRFAAQMNFDPTRPQNARARIDVELASVDAGGDDANTEVKSKNWFNVQQFPVATFVSSAVKALGGNRFEATGRMTIKGTTRNVIAPFTFRPEGGNGVFEGTFLLKRLDYGIGSGPWGDTDTVADEVQIRFRFLVAALVASGK